MRGVGVSFVSGENLEAELTSCCNSNYLRTRRSVLDKDSFELKVLAIHILNSEIFNPSAAVNITSIPIQEVQDWIPCKKHPFMNIFYSSEKPKEEQKIG